MNPLKSSKKIRGTVNNIKFSSFLVELSKCKSKIICSIRSRLDNRKQSVGHQKILKYFLFSENILLNLMKDETQVNWDHRNL